MHAPLHKLQGTAYFFLMCASGHEELRSQVKRDLSLQL